MFVLPAASQAFLRSSLVHTNGPPHSHSPPPILSSSLTARPSLEGLELMRADGLASFLLSTVQTKSSDTGWTEGTDKGSTFKTPPWLGLKTTYF